ncbi:hypothetical protein B5C34_13740 [Pacificimonas flava]|uniref:Uncharacterized protein n=2 Tax=Pacificimonas TaxID=1960290 RepID=A0A219B7R6_9SPHN|nr:MULTISPECIES: hypothetical protein [Pacificimonas]MBZ6379887.1 hypothetical protein [Pacificimonas aurantium]OWV34415.1 hypothetical protein B5C34_13740 [Pacificimonas flava]
MEILLKIALSVAVIGAFALLVGGAYILLRRPRAERKKGLLMIAVAVVTVTNVWLLTAPV